MSDVISQYSRDIALVAYSSHGSPDNKGTVSYLLEDSWPRLYIILGWEARPEAGVEVVLSVADTHLRYEKLMERELNGLVMKVREQHLGNNSLLDQNSPLPSRLYKIQSTISQCKLINFHAEFPTENCGALYNFILKQQIKF